jgi:hypothetical protein
MTPRPYRAVIAECRIDGIKGGSFDIVAKGRPTVGITVQRGGCGTKYLQVGAVVDADEGVDLWRCGWCGVVLAERARASPLLMES